MKKIYFALIGLFLFLQSCNTDININGEFTPVPVVYGILDQNDSIHMIKINRSYSGDGNTLYSASIADSSYWNQVEAYVYEIEKGNVQNQATWDTLRVWQLTDTIINTKDTNGVFYAPEQKVYYFSTPNTVAGALQDEYHYHFKAILNEGDYVVTGQTELVYKDNNSQSGLNVEFLQPTSYWDFINSNLNYKTQSSVWRVGNGMAFSVSLTLTYDEHIGATVTPREVTLELGDYDAEGIIGNTLTRVINGETFYQNIASKVVDDPSVDKRVITGMRYDIVAGSEDLYKYIQISQPSSSLSQNQPTYTNLDGAYGFFTARTTVSELKPAYTVGTPLRALNTNSTRELCTGAYTGTLKFCSSHPADAAFTWYCP